MRARHCGFTLLEVLVTLAVLGLLITGLVQGSRAVLSAWDQQTLLQARHADLDAVDRTLRTLIGSARPGSEWEQTVFVGTDHSLTFTSVMPGSLAGYRTPRADIEIAVDAAHRLLLVAKPHLHAIRIGPPAQAVATPIIDGVERLDVNYWRATPAGGWTSVWSDPIPPRLVKIRIVFSDAAHPPWPDIVAAPMLDSP